MYRNTNIFLKPEDFKIIDVIFKIIPSAVAIFDKNMKYISVSNKWYEETKMNPEVDLIGKFHYEVVPDIPLKWKLLHQRCLNGEHLKCAEDIFYRKDGSIEWVKWEITPWYDSSGVGGIVMFIEHLTERKEIENKLKNTIQKLKIFNVELHRFCHIYAHDMKEPVRTIHNFVEALDVTIKNKSYDVNKFMGYIKHSSIYLNKLISDILTYLEINVIPVNMKSINLNDVINSVSIILKEELEKNNASIFCGNLPEIYGDKDLLCQLFQNIISNAIKYNESKNPYVQISAKDIGKHWIITLSDNGIGIESKYYKSIFDPFARLHSKTEYSGSGLGLSHSKKIVEIHKGKIWVRSKEGIGSQFHVLLPK